jgi:hypothetical protein
MALVVVREEMGQMMHTVPVGGTKGSFQAVNRQTHKDGARRRVALRKIEVMS